jgi:putative colanic acid polymerase
MRKYTLNFNAYRWYSGMLLSCLLLLNFSPIKPVGYPLTLAPLIIPFLALYVVRFNLSFKLVGVFFILSSFILFKCIFDIVVYDVNLVGLFRTWALIQFFLLSLIIIKLPIVNSNMFGSTLQFTLMIFIALTAVIVTFQFVSYYVLGDISVFRVWGGMGYNEQSYVIKSIEHGRVRANGLYFEPSFLALVIFSTTSAIMIFQQSIFSTINKRYVCILFMSTFIIYLSGSRAGLISLSLLLLLPIIERMKLTYFILVFTLVSIILIALGNSEASIDSSIYYRLIAPLEIIGASLDQYTFGVPLGSMESFILSVGVLNGTEFGQTLDNGWYLIAFYFGWIGVFFVLLFLLFCIFLFVIGDRAQRILIIYLVLAPIFTGAVFSPEFFILMYVVCMSYKLKSGL